MQRKTRILIDDFNSIYAKEGKHTWKEMKYMADLASVISCAMLIENACVCHHGNPKHVDTMEDKILEELHDAEQKYLDYIKTQDQTLLNMAKGELRHAAYYISQAKMSADPGLIQRLKDYQQWYNSIESKLSHNPM